MNNIKKKLEEFNKRWSIVDDISYKDEFSKFKIRIFNIFKYIDRHVDADGIALFCNILGIAEKWDTNYRGASSKNIINALCEENDEKKFYRILEIIFTLPMKIEYSRYPDVIFSRQILYSQTKEVVEFSNINLAITKKDGEVIFYPKGEKALDKVLVEQVLRFLNDKSQKHFVDALKYYESEGKDNSIKSANSLRRSLEEFLRYKLNNNEGLDENISTLLKKLKEDQRDPQIRNIIQQIFVYMDKYFNENSKHKDGDIDKVENEYLIYQIGLLMRYIEFSLKRR